MRPLSQGRFQLLSVRFRFAFVYIIIIVVVVFVVTRTLLRRPHAFDFAFVFCLLLRIFFCFLFLLCFSIIFLQITLINYFYQSDKNGANGNAGLLPICLGLVCQLTIRFLCSLFSALFFCSTYCSQLDCEVCCLCRLLEWNQTKF